MLLQRDHHLIHPRKSNKQPSPHLLEAYLSTYLPESLIYSIQYTFTMPSPNSFVICKKFSATLIFRAPINAVKQGIKDESFVTFLQQAATKISRDDTLYTNTTKRMSERLHKWGHKASVNHPGKCKIISRIRKWRKRRFRIRGRRCSLQKQIANTTF